MTWQCGDERSSFKMMKSRAKERNAFRTRATRGKIAEKEESSRNHELNFSEFLLCAVLGLRSPHKKGRLVMARLREKAEKKRESRPFLRVGSTSRFLRLEKKQGGSRGEKRITRRPPGWRLWRGRELGGRTDGRGVHKGRRRRQAAGERNTAAEIVCG